MSGEINYFHILGVAPILGYVAYENYMGRALSQSLSVALMLIILVMVLFHAYLISIKTTKEKIDAVDL